MDSEYQKIELYMQKDKQKLENSEKYFHLEKRINLIENLLGKDFEKKFNLI